jgi:hypothetical protein
VSILTSPFHLTNELVKQETLKVESLDESDLLSDLFKDPAKKTLHIAVKFSPIGEHVAVDLTGKMTYAASTSAAADIVHSLPLLRLLVDSDFIATLH